MKFILSRTDDFHIHSKKWIVGYGLLFWLISRIFAMLLIIGCIAIYKTCGIDPESQTSFIGNPETAKTIGSTVYVLMTVSIVAPLLEECIFRLGLSFRRWQVALAASAIPAYMLWQHIYSCSIAYVAICAFAMAVLFSAIYFFTTDSFWNSQKKKYYKPSIYVSAIAFGLLHLIAFSNYDYTLIPYMLCVISVPFFAGCAITYYRVNLGFWWGVGLHIFNNIPAIVVMLSI